MTARGAWENWQTEPMARTDSELDALAVEELDDRVRTALSALGRRSDPAAFAVLLGLSQATGEAIGSAARTLAEGGSWARVADVAGTTRQAAWSRWSEPTS
jgi:hypothetical protein